MLRKLALSSLLAFALPALALADGTLPPKLEIGGYIQPQVRLRQESDVQSADDGFRLARARLRMRGWQPVNHLRAFAYLEAELTPSFQLFDAAIGIGGDFDRDSGWRLTLGQHKAPFSRQTLVTNADLQLPEKAALTTITPDRQLGASVTLNLPWLSMIELSGGVFNGKGKNLVDNLDSNFMYVARLALRPIGPRAPLVESALGEDALSIAGSFYWNTLTQSAVTEEITAVGVDGFASWNGLSATGEWVLIHHSFSDGSGQPNYNAQGLNLQAGWLLPLPGSLYRRFEIAARLEEIDRNDTVPIPNPGHPDQSTRSYILGVSYYQNKHKLKLQLSAAHVVQLEDRTASRADATFPADTLILQATYRL